VAGFCAKTWGCDCQERGVTISEV